MTDKREINDINWPHVARLMLTARRIDYVEENELYPQKKIAYQFSSRGHALCQVILANELNHPKDAVGPYYRSRPALLTLGQSVEDAISSSLAKEGSYSDGRDIGVVCNLPSTGRATVLPMAGDVGSQYTSAVGWAQSIVYHRHILKDYSYNNAIVSILGGEGSVATNGFWSALTIATTLSLPVLFFIEDNGFAISVPANKQTPGGDIAKNLRSFTNLEIDEGDGTDPVDAATRILQAVDFVRHEQRPYLLRLQVPRLSGHSGQDNQAYKSKALLAQERAEDPFIKLRSFMVPSLLSEQAWQALESEVEVDVALAVEKALSRKEPDASRVLEYAFSEKDKPQIVGGLVGAGVSVPGGSSIPLQGDVRINLVEGVRMTLASELRRNPRALVFGEDVGPKGGVHAATLGLQDEFGEERVFDTSLSEEGIVGRAEGMSLCGLLPVCEIQFRKYTDPATERINNLGTLRWRTNNRFAAPVIIRVAGGASKRVGDPWHSVSAEAVWAHTLGWRIAIPSNTEDAVGLLRSAMWGNDPTFFFEHRALLDSAWARRPYPGDDFVLPYGVANTLREGTALTVVSWGAMLERCEQAIDELGASIELIDLRTICPWDKKAVLSSVAKTKRCMIVHEDTRTCGFAAEISAVLAEEAFFDLDAPICRVTTPDVLIPYNVNLMNAVVPSVEQIRERMSELLLF